MREPTSLLDQELCPPFRLGDWHVEPDLNRLSRGDNSIQIEPKVMAVLVCLVRSTESVVTKNKLLETVWRDTYVTDKVLTYSISELRKALEDDPRNPRIIQTISRRGYRIIAPVSWDEKEAPSVPPEIQPAPPKTENRPIRLLVPIIAILVVVGLGGIWYLRSVPVLKETDYVFLGPFANTTGDASLDEVLRQALAIHLEQSPYLNVFPEERVRATMQYMGKPSDEVLTRPLALEICQRQGVRAMLSGSIASLGRNYVVSLEALDAGSGETIARQQIEVSSKEQLLTLVGKGATLMRKQLGESLASIQRFDVPLEQATTPSLEAFKAYSMARKFFVRGQMLEALPLYLRALESDPDFASAYDDLAWCYARTAQLDLAAEAARKAYALRHRVSEYERHSIEAVYHYFATGQIEKGIETLELMRSVYPRSAPVHNTLGVYYARLGQHEKAVEAYREALRLNHHPNAYPNLARSYLMLNRLDGVREALAQAATDKIDMPALHELAFMLAYMDGNQEEMDRQLQWAAGKPSECFLVRLQALAAANAGHLRRAHELEKRAVALAQQNSLAGAAADFAASSMLRDALWGSCNMPTDPFQGIPVQACDWISQGKIALACALCGKPGEAAKIAERLSETPATHTLLHGAWLPLVRGVLALEGSRTDEALREFDLAMSHDAAAGLWPSYFRALAYLKAGDGSSALADMKKILSNRGMCAMSPIYPLARIGVGRAHESSGDLASARNSYQEFLAGWKGADADIPFLERARADYRRIEDRPKTAWLLQHSLLGILLYPMRIY